MGGEFTVNSTHALPIARSMDDISVLCREYQVQELFPFGSVLRETFRQESDIDLFVLIEPGAMVGFLERASLQFALADLVDREIDPGPKKGPNPVIRSEVLASARVIYAAGCP
jgi:predicted nucleotidyltransferase